MVEGNTMARKGGGKLALMFLVKEGPNSPGMWRQWLKDVPRERYTIQVHAKHEHLCCDPDFKANLIQSVPTEWGTTSLVDAHIALLRAALQDPGNRFFVLLSDACLPVVSFQKVCEELGMGEDNKTRWEDDKSFFDQHEPQQQRHQGEYLRERLRSLRESSPCDVFQQDAMRVLDELLDPPAGSQAGGIQPHSQWCVLTRRHAEILCDDAEKPRQRRELLLKALDCTVCTDDVHNNLTLAPDELFALSFLCDYGKRANEVIRFVKRRTTYCRCCLDPDDCKCGSLRAKHPYTLVNLNPLLIQQCHLSHALFARKFKCGVEDNGGRKWWFWLWLAANSTHEPADVLAECVKLAKLCDWDVKMRSCKCAVRRLCRCVKPSEREQDQLAAYLSLNPEPEGCIPPLTVVGDEDDEDDEDDMPLEALQRKARSRAQDCRAGPVRKTAEEEGCGACVGKRKAGAGEGEAGEAKGSQKRLKEKRRLEEGLEGVRGALQKGDGSEEEILEGAVPRMVKVLAECACVADAIRVCQFSRVEEGGGLGSATPDSHSCKTTRWLKVMVERGGLLKVFAGWLSQEAWVKDCEYGALLRGVMQVLGAIPFRELGLGPITDSEVFVKLKRSTRSLVPCDDFKALQRKVRNDCDEYKKSQQGATENQNAVEADASQAGTPTSPTANFSDTGVRAQQHVLPSALLV